MTVLTQAYSVTYQGNGATTVWPFAFDIPDPTDANVQLTDNSVTPPIITNIPFGQFGITGTGQPGGGSVTYPIAGSALPATTKITIWRSVPYVQPVDISNQGAFFADVLEDGLDNLEYQIQQLVGGINRAIKVPITDAVIPPPDLPAASARANQNAIFDAQGNMTAGLPVAGGINISLAMQPVVQAATIHIADNLLGISDAMIPVVGAPTTAAAAALLGVVPQARNPNANLAEFMDARYGVGGWTYWGGNHTGTDAGPAMDDALIALRGRYGRGYLDIAGPFRVATPPSSTNLSGNIVRGVAGIFSSEIIYDANTGALFQFSGSGGFDGGGLENLSIFLEADYPSSTAAAILVQGNATFQEDNCRFEHLYITTLGGSGGHPISYWYYGFLVFGNARTAPQGVRVGTVKDMQIFRCSNFGAEFSSALQWTIENLGIYVPSTTNGPGGDLYITGGGAANTNTAQLWMTGVTVASTLHMANATMIEGSAQCNQVLVGGTLDFMDLRIHAITSGGVPGGHGIYVVY